MANNTGYTGGAIYLKKSYLSFSGQSVFFGNKAFAGGAIYSALGSMMIFSGLHNLSMNKAETDGGAIHVMGTNITATFQATLVFNNNSAQHGGAIYFSREATLTMARQVSINTSYNHATELGGALYHEDNVVPIQCSFTTYQVQEIDLLPSCFLHLRSITTDLDTPHTYQRFHSYKDSAGRIGSFLHGGLLDRCQMEMRNYSDPEQLVMVPYNFLQAEIFNTKPMNDLMKITTSQPYQLCFCESSHSYSCTGMKNIEVLRGQKFNVSLKALDQTNSFRPALITAKVSETASLSLHESLQFLTQECSNLTFTLHSTESQENLVLYPDGPCHDTGLARAVINVTVKSCPSGFAQAGGECTCERRLLEYGAKCTIGKSVYITRESGLNFWMSFQQTNKIYSGLILSRACPVNYCVRNAAVNIMLDNPNVQCKQNRGNLLCGQCLNKSSLLLGGYQCQICSNAYLGLLLPFAAAGIALVIVLSFLRMTVSDGILNSVILYANILQVNKNIYFPDNTFKFLTVFIAWMNLDFGFETCFYNGMDAYAQTWLQFAFPVYLWVLISLIIVSSRYSINVSKLLGHNPIAVLATLLLMSYTKILKIIIEVYSSADLYYPDNKTVIVWLKDANIPYLQSEHLLLTVITTLILVFFFLPYTVLLLLGYIFYRFSARRGFHWLNWIKPFLDSYYAPYKINTRHWTGFLLLVRCTLYIVFSLCSKQGSLLATTTAVTAIITVAWLIGRIYEKLHVDIIAASVYINLIVLSAATASGTSPPELVNTLVGIVFVTMMAIIMYHFYQLFSASKPAMWMNHKLKRLYNLSMCKVQTQDGLTSDKQMQENSMTGVSQTDIDLREPLLDQ